MNDFGEISQGRISRSAPFAALTAQAMVGRFIAGLQQHSGRLDAVDRFHESTAEKYASLLGQSKGVLMKAGQILSLLDCDVAGNAGFRPYRDALRRMQADAPPMHPRLVRDVLDAELGNKIDIFSEFDATPLAAASIGQVHRAVLNDGRHVAVKIQYPGVARAIRADLRNTELLATFMRFAMCAAGSTRDMTVVANEAAARIAEEIDYEHEAENVDKFGELYRGHPFIRIPEVIREASAERVLTMTYMNGVDWNTAQNASQELRNSWAETIVRFSRGNIRYSNMLYADPHPDNYRFNMDGTVSFLDFGCVKILPEYDRFHVVALTRAAIDGRMRDVRTIMMQAGYFDEEANISIEELTAWWSDLLYDIIVLPQPVAYTGEVNIRTVGGYFTRDVKNPVLRMKTPPHYSLFPRVTFAVNSICATLRAVLPARAIADDSDGIIEPVTELGKLHHTWMQQRELSVNAGEHNLAPNHGPTT